VQFLVLVAIKVALCFAFSIGFIANIGIAVLFVIAIVATVHIVVRKIALQGTWP